MRDRWCFLMCVLLLGPACTVRDPTYCDEDMPECPEGHVCDIDAKTCVPVDAGVPIEGGVDLAHDAARDVGDGPLTDFTSPDGPLAKNGTACTADAQCASGFCVDDYCCESRCDSTCRDCAAPGKEGICSLIPDGKDPAGECKGSVAACNGTCDGQGACTFPGTGTPCGSPKCMSGSLETSECDGKGGCSTSETGCGGYACDVAGSACKTSCTTDSDCTGTFKCVGNKCVNSLPLGASCGTNDSACASGHCVDSVCCSSTCTGTCKSCNLAGKKGSCSDVPSGQDPDIECGGSDPACAGACSGSGACTYAPATKQCKTPVCSGATLTTYSCDGAGACSGSSSKSCGGYGCASGSACATSCTVDANCVGGYYCIDTKCVNNLANGSACSGKNGVCASGFCVDGVCCNSACTNTCQKCNLTGKSGTCSDVANGTSCGTTSCSGNILATATCQNGTCSTSSAPCPGELKCASATACKTSCTSDADCISGAACVSGTCKSWGTAKLIETDNAGGASLPQVAVDSNGNVTAAWRQSDGTHDNIWANRYNAMAKAWGTAQLIETDNAGDAANPQVAVDPSGNVTAVWGQSDGTRSNIWANRHSATTGKWIGPQLIENNNAGGAANPQVEVDPNGNMTAVWHQYDGSTLVNNIWANRYSTMAGKWNTAQLIETHNAGNALFPQLVVDPNGNATVVWEQSEQNDGTQFNIWVNRYSAMAGKWDTAQLLETDNAGDAHYPQVAVDPNGNATAVWEQSDGTQFNIWANRYSATAGKWIGPQLIETNAGTASNAQVAVDPNGNATAVWEQSDGTQFNIWANRYSATTGAWGTTQLIETNVGEASYPQVAVDPNGNATVVWYQNDGTRENIWANRFSATTGAWGTAQLIETDNAGSAYRPQVAVDPNGNATAVWHQNDGTRYNIWANRFE